jgi:hypothetical protein
MANKAEASFAKDYRDARKAFIAACEHAHGDSITRVHPTALGPDGKPLFIDSVAFGSREAAKALLVIAGANGEAGLLGSHILASLLDSEVTPLPGTRLVLVHALNPFGFAWGRHGNEDGLGLDDPAASQSWSFAALRAIATEDLARTRKLRILEIGQGQPSEIVKTRDYGPARVLKALMPKADLIAARLILQPAHPGDLAESVVAKSVVVRALATL